MNIPKHWNLTPLERHVVRAHRGNGTAPVRISWAAIPAILDMRPGYVTDAQLRYVHRVFYKMAHSNRRRMLEAKYYCLLRGRENWRNLDVG